MLHGYSDSPYSLRSLARLLHQSGGEVLGLRIPGHGTAPSALIQTTFADMAAAVRIGARHLGGKLGGKPIFIVGYSNGGALAAHYALASLEDSSLPRPAGIILISPEIGIAEIAAYSDWQARLGDLLGLDKLAWNAVQPEYDPYKYNSFAVNAGYQAYQATVEIQSQLDRLEKQGRLGEIQPILAFQSAADATVEAPALLTKLFDRLKPGAHQLVLFDVNRIYKAQGLITTSLDVEDLLAGPTRAYDVSVLTNRDNDSAPVVAHERPAGDSAVTATELGLDWPEEVYSLSHIALPFPPDDPLYGEGSGSENPGIRLGRLDLRGENRTLAIPNTAMTRQHWNPFFAYLSDRTRAFVMREADTTLDANNPLMRQTIGESVTAPADDEGQRPVLP
jgi:alpha-beta hydrolase superfamily lysophospholipase